MCADKSDEDVLASLILDRNSDADDCDEVLANDRAQHAHVVKYTALGSLSSLYIWTSLRTTTASLKPVSLRWILMMWAPEDWGSY